MLLAHNTAIALDHLIVRIERRRPHRTSHSAAMAADAVGVIVDGQVGDGVLAQDAHRAALNAGSIITVHAGNRGIEVFPIQFEIGHPAKRCHMGNVDIVLIHAGYGASAAGTAFIHIQYQFHLHEWDTSSSLMIRQRTQL